MTLAWHWLLAGLPDPRCWADDGSQACWGRPSTNALGLCRIHYIEIVGREP